MASDLADASSALIALTAESWRRGVGVATGGPACSPCLRLRPVLWTVSPVDAAESRRATPLGVLCTGSLVKNERSEVWA